MKEKVSWWSKITIEIKENSNKTLILTTLKKKSIIQTKKNSNTNI